MLNYNLLFGFIVLLAAASCRPSAIAFRPEKNLDTAFFHHITGIIRDKKGDDGKKGAIEKIYVYKAVLENIPVERDAISENKLINTKSKEEILDEATVNGWHELYLFRVFTSSKQDDNLFVFMATTFNRDSQCLKLGPAYMGKIRMEQFHVSKELSFVKQSGSGFYLDKAMKRKLVFYATGEPGKDAGNVCDGTNEDAADCRIKIIRIINMETNKIGGEKFLIYNTSTVFGDENALVFTFSGTIKP